MLTLLTIGVSGGKAVSWEEYVTVLIPLVIGIVLSAIDEKIKVATKNGISIILPVMGFILGSGIDLSKIIISGFGGIFLFVLVIIITGPVALFADRILLKRPSYAGMTTVSVPGNTIAVPAMIGQLIPAFRDYVNLATVQISCAVVLSAIICPLIVHWFAKHFGCPRYKEVFQKIEVS